jgi:hypothetical protein
MTFSMPLALPISSATDFTPLPAMKAVTEPPILVPAVTAASDAGWNFPSFCSSIANVEANRAKAEWCGTAMGRDCRRCDRAMQTADVRAVENMADELGNTEQMTEDDRVSVESYCAMPGLTIAESDDLGTTVIRLALRGSGASAAVTCADRRLELQGWRQSIANHGRDDRPSHPPPSPHLALPTINNTPECDRVISPDYIHTLRSALTSGCASRSANPQRIASPTPAPKLWPTTQLEQCSTPCLPWKVPPTSVPSIKVSPLRAFPLPLRLPLRVGRVVTMDGCHQYRPLRPRALAYHIPKAHKAKHISHHGLLINLIRRH